MELKSIRIAKRVRRKIKSLLRTSEHYVQRWINSSSGKRNNNKLASYLLAGLSTTVVLGLGIFSIAQTDEVIVVQGRLYPRGRVRDVIVPSGFRVKTIFVESGMEIKQGDRLIELDVQAASTQKEKLKDTIAIKQAELSLKKRINSNKLLENSHELEIVDEKTRTLRQSLAVEKKILDKYKELARIGAIAKIQLYEQEQTVTRTRSEYNSQIIERKRLIRQSDQDRLMGDQDLGRIRSDINSLETQYEEASLIAENSVIKSPIDGKVFDLKIDSPGYTNLTEYPVMKIVPKGILEARIEIPSEKIGFVYSGQMVELSVDSFPASDFGVLNAQVKEIGSDALEPDAREMRETFVFPARVLLESQSIKHKGKVMSLQAGMTLTANLKLRKVSYLSLLLNTFREKVESIRSY